ncbi:MAG: peptidoglycan DD-metalloendopeptidase family protein [Alphaproteobacteria bacterium]|nr:peptidoglycan DD-metalloendopeptidase family protein [Alphaproteobacteria bacterium]
MTDEENRKHTENEKNKEAHAKCLCRIMIATEDFFKACGEFVYEFLSDDADEAQANLFSKPKLLRTVSSFVVGISVGIGVTIGYVNLMDAKKTQKEKASIETIDQVVIEPKKVSHQFDFDLTESVASAIEATKSKVEEKNDIAEEIENQLLELASVEKYQIKPRENLAALLKRAGVENSEIYRITTALSEVINLKKIQIGDQVEIGYQNTQTVPPEKQLVTTTIEDKDGNRYIASKSNENSFEAQMLEAKVTTRKERAEGEVVGSFIASAKNAGIPANVIQQIIWSFNGLIDFAKDIQKNDTFSAVFEKEYNKNNEPTGKGQLIFASFKLRYGVQERYYYEDSKGQKDYYDESGKIAHKLFQNHPLKFQRITSKFGIRKHPILGYKLAHNGIDYGAPEGTPIRAPGNGTITEVGKRGGYGKFIGIRHNSEFATGYGHLSKFAKGIVPGKKVKAGEIIGYVGNTGRSTGPHLHWEVIKNGRKINPATQQITAQKRLSGNELSRFIQQRDILRQQLEQGDEYFASKPLEAKTAKESSSKNLVINKRLQKAFKDRKLSIFNKFNFAMFKKSKG